MADKPPKIEWVCHQGLCFEPPNDLSEDLAKKLDVDQNGIISDQNGVGATHEDFIEMGNNDIAETQEQSL